jgi:hypothetical protein
LSFVEIAIVRGDWDGEEENESVVLFCFCRRILVEARKDLPERVAERGDLVPV